MMSGRKEDSKPQGGGRRHHACSVEPRLSAPPFESSRKPEGPEVRRPVVVGRPSAHLFQPFTAVGVIFVPGRISSLPRRTTSSPNAKVAEYFDDIAIQFAAPHVHPFRDTSLPLLYGLNRRFRRAPTALERVDVGTCCFPPALGDFDIVAGYDTRGGARRLQALVRALRSHGFRFGFRLLCANDLRFTLRALGLSGGVDRRVFWNFGLTSAAGGLTGALLHGWASNRAQCRVWRLAPVRCNERVDRTRAAHALSRAHRVDRRRHIWLARRSGWKPGRPQVRCTSGFDLSKRSFVATAQSKRSPVSWLTPFAGSGGSERDGRPPTTGSVSPVRDSRRLARGIESRSASPSAIEIRLGSRAGGPPLARMT
jgi:hypothetical protein